MGVRPDHQGRGIGSELIRCGLNEAYDCGEPAVVLLGNPNFNRRFGFVAASTFGLRNPKVGVQPNGFVILEEHFMIVPLDERAESLSAPFDGVPRCRYSQALGHIASPRRTASRRSRIGEVNPRDEGVVTTEGALTGESSFRVAGDIESTG